MEQTEIIKLAVRVNAKEESVAIFEKLVGVSFKDFLRLKSNNKAFLIEWNVYIKEKSKGIKQAKKIAKENKKDYTKDCICKEAENFPSHIRSVSKTPIAMWHCAVHGNRCNELAK